MDKRAAGQPGSNVAPTLRLRPFRAALVKAQAALLHSQGVWVALRRHPEATKPPHSVQRSAPTASRMRCSSSP